MRKLYTFLLVLLTATALQAQPGNTCANALVIGNSGCSGAQTMTGTELYYTVTATVASHFFQVYNSDTLNGYATQLELFGATCTGSPLFTATVLPLGKAVFGITASGLTPGQAYILRVSRSGPNPGTAAFELCRQQWTYSPTSVCSNPCNLLCNGDFENFTQGPSFDPINCIGGNQLNACLSQNCWTQLGANNNPATTPDYHNAQFASCVTAPSIPNSCFGHVGLAANLTSWREYIQQSFSFPTTGTYQIAYSVRRLQPTVSGTNFGFLLTQTPPTAANFFYSTTPTFSSTIAATNNSYQRITANVTITNTTSAFTIAFGVFDALKNCPNEYFMLDDVVITPVPPVLSYYTPTCTQTGLNFSAANPNGTITWTCTPALPGFPSTAQTVLVPAPVPAGSYTITVTTNSAQGCTSTSIPINVSPSPPAQITPAGPLTICQPNIATLTASSGNYVYQWFSSSSPTGQGAQAIPGATSNTLNPLTSNYYYVVVTDPITGCSSTSNIVQVLVRPSPVAGILGSTNERCDAANNGTALAGATGGTAPYTYAWSTSPVQTTALATNLSAGSYTVTVTDVNGCTASAVANIGTQPPLAAPVVTSDASSGNLCQSSTVIYTVTNYDPSLQYTFTTSIAPLAVNQLSASVWEVDWGSSCQSVRFTITASNGNALCDVSTVLELSACCPCNPGPTDAFMGGYVGSRTVVDLYNTYNSTGIITNPTPGVYTYNNPSGTLYINGAFLVPNGTIFNIVNSDVQFGSGASIVVPGNNSPELNVTGSHLHAGCNEMWEGMQVTGGGEINITNSLIEDAEKAVYSALGANYTITNTVFNRNYIGVELNTFVGNHPGSVTNTVFTSRQLPAGANVALLKGPQTFTNFIQDFPVSGYAPGALIAPRTGQRGSIGVHVRNNGAASVSQTTYQVTGFTAVRIGASTGYSGLNVFDNLDYGVYAHYSNVIVENNAFQYLTGPQQVTTNTPNYGVGVYGTTFSEQGDVWVAHIGSGAASANTFWNCNRGVDLNGYYDVVVNDNRFHSAQVYGTSPVPAPVYGAYGVFVKGGYNARTDVQFNEIANITQGIALFADALPASSGQYYKLIGMAHLSDNRIAANPSFGPALSGAFVRQGIVIQNIIPPCSNCLSEVAIDRLYAENNVMEQVFNGIRLMNWNKYPRIADNQIGLKYQAPAAPQQFPQQGIRVMNSLTPVVYHNTIIGDVQCLTKISVRGIYGTRSASGIWQCNYIQNVGQCLVFEGNCGAAKVFTNQMYDAQDGLVLLNNGIIGPQGFLPSATNTNGAVCDNFWFGPFSHADTYTDQTFLPATHSPLFIRNTAAPGYIPVVNLTTGAFSFDDYGSIGAIVLTNSPAPVWNCNEPAPIAEQGGTGDKADQLKGMEKIVLDELELSGFVAAGQWMDKKETYEQLLADTTLLDTSAVLQAFYADAPTHSYGKVAAANELAGANNLTGAQAAGAMLPENADAEYNHKQVVLLYTKRMSGDTLDAAELVALEQIARTCPLYGGTAVYQAQALLCLVSDQVLYFEEECFVPVNANRKPRVQMQQTGAATTGASVFPNPASTSLTINCASTDGLPLLLIVRDLTGRVVLTQQLAPQSSLHTVSVELLAQGAYSVTVTAGQTTLINQLVVINK